MDIGILDLVEHDGKRYVVCGTADGRLNLSTDSWPAEFDSFSEYDAFAEYPIPSAVTVSTDAVTMVESAPDRIDAFNTLLREHSARSTERERVDWDDVDRALEHAVAILPAQLLDIDFDSREWRLPEAVPDEICAALAPAAILIATHAIGSGEADVSDVTAAYERADALISGPTMTV